MLLSLFCGATVYIFLFLLSEWKEYCGIIPPPAASWLFPTLSEAGGCCIILFFLLLFFLCLFVTQRWFLHALAPRTTAIVISRFRGPPRNVGMRRGCWGATVGSVYRSKDAALCYRDHGCNIKTVGLIHDGAAASAVQTLPPKYLSVEKSESKVARRQRPPKKLLVALLFFSPLL